MCVKREEQVVLPQHIYRFEFTSRFVENCARISKHNLRVGDISTHPLPFSRARTFCSKSGKVEEIERDVLFRLPSSITLEL